MISHEAVPVSSETAHTDVMVDDANGRNAWYLVTLHPGLEVLTITSNVFMVLARLGSTVLLCTEKV